MWTQTLDLHSHSLHSDGEHPVQDVARLMHEEGVQTWSLTDHDTTSGWNEAASAAASLGMRFLPGVEITCEPALPPDQGHLDTIGRERASASWHLLAYFPEHRPGINDDTVAGFKAWLEPHQDGRLPRMKAMCQRLTELGMPVDVEDVCRRASGSVGRPHLAQAMVELGYVSSKLEAFETWIGDGLPAFVPHIKPTIAEAVEAVRSANGFTSLAHPLYYGVPTKSLVERLGQLGVDAVEAVHRSHTDAYRFELMNEAVSNGMTITVGSDFHGLSWQARPGNMPLQVLALDARLNDA
ncbi:MAG TPA: PHP domain-containing protein [Candidatus Poseidoniales archaeon]|nr:MAG TPA: PHP domain-containing protein [Candidatus Poseidoniales archaeon]HII77624.1 PHP domain-containing protein [Poseidonia sp.]|tara:strand:- start:16713 stop:17600 length:888 start_codon:yes stop_codon:yes gene_type:complete